MTSRQKVLEVERQVRAIISADEPLALVCPFCEQITEPGCDMLCCNEAAEVVDAVLNYIETEAQLEVVDRVMNRWAKMQSRVLVN